MAIYRVFYERTELEYADIEADSAEEAETYADENYTDCEWTYVEDSMAAALLEGETELL